MKTHLGSASSIVAEIVKLADILEGLAIKSNSITRETKSQGQVINNIGNMAQILASSSEQLRGFLNDSIELIKQTDRDVMNLKKYLISK